MDYTIIENFLNGQSLNAYEIFGSHQVVFNNKKGIRFTVWAPNASKIEVIGSFNNWDGTNYEMKKNNKYGIFTLFVEGLKPIYSYKYRIYNGDKYNDKIDPFANYSEKRPNNASIIYPIDNLKWDDQKWISNRSKDFSKPISIYEVHLGAWIKKSEEGDFYTYREVADQLVDYVIENHFTHIEIMPITEYSFDGSWGYQSYGFFSVNSRYGTPEDLVYLVNKCHENNIGVIMDMVLVHFIPDNFALREYDGTCLYEYNNENKHSEWGSLNFDLWKEPVRSFLMSSVNFWLDKFHFDGIRFDAVSNLIYWGGNKDRGRNEGAIDFIKRLNYNLNQLHPNILLIAEDSSDFAKVTKPIYDGGLGFDYKWDLGWMNDTLNYYKKDPIYRKYHHNSITFSMAYFYSENFILPFSHDEVVHGKGTIVDKMWGSYEQKFAQVRNLYLYMFTHPGKKLNFMGNEFAMFREFDEEKELDWFMLKYPVHDAFNRYFKDLNSIYNQHPALYKYDYDYTKFKWIDADNNNQSIYSYYREDENEYLVVVLNMTPNQYEEYELGVPQYGYYEEIINSEKDIYSGCNMCNDKKIRARKGNRHHQDYYIKFKIAPFAGMMFKVNKRKVNKNDKRRKTV